MKIGTWIGGIGLGMVMMLSLAGCMAPRSFVRSAKPEWSSIPVRADLTYDQAWDTTVDYLIKEFNFEVLARQDGYIRTEWLYTSTGKQRADYRVRIYLKFSRDRSRAEIKSEAEYGGADRWKLGVDTTVLETVKKGLSRAIGSVGN